MIKGRLQGGCNSAQGKLTVSFPTYTPLYSTSRKIVGVPPDRVIDDLLPITIGIDRFTEMTVDILSITQRLPEIGAE